MKVKRLLIAPDKFKGSLTATEVCDAVTRGVRLVDERVSISAVPMADGGEGTSRLLTENAGGNMITVPVNDPLNRPINASFGIAGETAFIDVASASGLQLLADHERNPLHTSTIGTGMLVEHAIGSGVRKIVLGLGGSATNDAGTGLAYALGYRFYDKAGDQLIPMGRHLIDIVSIEPPTVRPEFECTVLCDVSNPLYGSDGAAYVFGPQKGVTSQEEIEMLDEGLRNIARIVQRDFSIDLNFPGAGAAGGLGAGARFFLEGKLVSGIRYVMSETNLIEKISAADLVITGEGKLDLQSLSGKVIAGVAEQCHKMNKPYWILTGKNDLPENHPQLKADRIIALVRPGVSKQSAIGEAAEHIVALISQEWRSL